MMAARNQSHPTPPYLSQHAEDRWEERAERVDDYDDLWTAWVDAEPVTLPRPYCHVGDESRYHRDANVILCRRETTITTVYDVSGSDADRSVQRAVENQLDVTLEDTQ